MAAPISSTRGPQQSTCDVVILAAGKGSRLNSQLPKVLHPLLGKPLLGHVIAAVHQLMEQPSTNRLALGRIVVVVGHGRQQVEDYLATITSDVPIVTVVQTPQQGTGHALQQVANQLLDLAETVLLLAGDVPLLRGASLADLLASHQRASASITVLGATVANPTGYGRLIVAGNALQRIVEEKDTTDAEKVVKVVNTGVAAYHWPTISPLLEKLSNANAQGEWYATDLVGLANTAGYPVATVLLDDADDMQGVNTRVDLAHTERLLQERINRHWMLAGVTMADPQTTWIGPDVKLEADVTLEPGTRLLGQTTVASHATIGPWTTLTNAIVGSRSTVYQSVVTDSIIGEQCTVGPFAHIRNQCVLGNHVRLGNFVEAKATTIADHSNAAHLAYLGNATIGHHVNMGAGSIIANYDPIRLTKTHTTIGDGAKVGCNAVLVAPVTLGEDTCVAAGSTVTRDVADGDLAIARSRQTVVEGWVTTQYAQQKAAPDGAQPPQGSQAAPQGMPAHSPQ